MTMEDMIFDVIAVSIWILIPIIIYLKKRVLNYSLFEKVGWIIAPYRERNLHDRNTTSLLDELVYKQQDLELPREYRLELRDNKTEIENTQEILEVFKKYISEQYFGGYLSNTLKIRVLNDDWYFFYSLFEFIKKYAEYDNYELRDKMYKYESTDGSYHTHSLTDYGRAFYKLYLISLLYVESNPYILKLYKYIDPELKEHLKSHLDNNEVTFWNYRP